MALYRQQLVPDSFSVPLNYRTKQFVLRPLTVEDNEQDYQAVMSGVDADGELDVPDGLTKGQNLINLGWHQKEFEKRSSFIYAIISPAENEYYGCVYIYPLDEKSYDAELAFWLTSKAHKQYLLKTIYQELRLWMSKSWSFKKVRYLGYKQGKAQVSLPSYFKKKDD